VFQPPRYRPGGDKPKLARNNGEDARRFNMFDLAYARVGRKDFIMSGRSSEALPSSRVLCSTK
jgi:hypothetical protein